MCPLVGHKCCFSDSFDFDKLWPKVAVAEVVI